MFQKYGKVFKYTTIRYGLVVRLGLKYRTTSKTRLVFTPQRIALADEFCVKLPLLPCGCFDFRDVQIFF